MQRAGDVSTRMTILHNLRTQGSLSVSELAVQLAITEVAVRRHIQSLEQNGMICATVVRQAKGRPLHRYALTPEADHLFPKNYYKLTLDLLEELEQEERGMVDKLFERRKRRMAKRYGARMEGRSLQERVRLLAQIQDESGYMVRVEEEGSGDYLLHEHNCPIAQVAYQYQQACQCELQLFEQLLAASVERTECLAKGGAKCT